MPWFLIQIAWCWSDVPWVRSLCLTLCLSLPRSASRCHSVTCVTRAHIHNREKERAEGEEVPRSFSLLIHLAPPSLPLPSLSPLLPLSRDPFAHSVRLPWCALGVWCCDDAVAPLGNQTGTSNKFLTCRQHQHMSRRQNLKAVKKARTPPPHTHTHTHTHTTTSHHRHPPPPPPSASPHAPPPPHAPPLCPACILFLNRVAVLW